MNTLAGPPATKIRATLSRNYDATAGRIYAGPFLASVLTML